MARDVFPVVVHVLMFRGEELFLLRRANSGFMDGYFALPGGHQQAGESVEAAAQRECEEFNIKRVSVELVAIGGCLDRDRRRPGDTLNHLGVRAGATRDSGDDVFRQAMVDGTVTASFCPEGFNVEGLLKIDDAAYAIRLATLRGMMVP